MKRLEYFKIISKLFEFKQVVDKKGNEFILFADSTINSIDSIEDRTDFESSENHIHILRNIKKFEMEDLILIGKVLGETLLGTLRLKFPDREFIVYVTLRLNDSMIIRFHQKWENELPYCNPSEFKSEKEKVFAFETNQDRTGDRTGDGSKPLKK